MFAGPHYQNPFSDRRSGNGGPIRSIRPIVHTRAALMGYFLGCSLWLLVLTGFGLAADSPKTNAGKRLDASAAARAVVPSSVDVALGIGGREGKGVSTCHTPKGWSAPAPFSLKAGSVGLQIGAEKMDVIMIVMSQEAMTRLLSGKFKVGKDITGQAGPVGSESSGDQTWKNSEVLSYSKSRGAFKGIDLKGASIKQDKKATVAVYGRYIPFASILKGKVPAPAEAHAFLTTIVKYTTDSHRPAQEDRR